MCDRSATDVMTKAWLLGRDFTAHFWHNDEAISFLGVMTKTPRFADRAVEDRSFLCNYSGTLSLSDRIPLA